MSAGAGRRCRLRLRRHADAIATTSCRSCAAWRACVACCSAPPGAPTAWSPALARRDRDRRQGDHDRGRLRRGVDAQRVAHEGAAFGRAIVAERLRADAFAAPATGTCRAASGGDRVGLVRAVPAPVVAELLGVARRRRRRASSVGADGCCTGAPGRAPTAGPRRSCGGSTHGWPSTGPGPRRRRAVGLRRFGGRPPAARRRRPSRLGPRSRSIALRRVRLTATVRPRLR